MMLVLHPQDFSHTKTQNSMWMRLLLLLPRVDVYIKCAVTWSILPQITWLASGSKKKDAQNTKEYNMQYSCALKPCSEFVKVFKHFASTTTFRHVVDILVLSLTILTPVQWPWIQVCKYVCLHVCMYIYIYIYNCIVVCMHVCLYVCMYVCIYPCIFVSVYVCMCAHICICTCVCMHACKYVSMHACMYVCMIYVCMYLCMYVCIYVCTYVFYMYVWMYV